MWGAIAGIAAPLVGQAIGQWFDHRGAQAANAQNAAQVRAQMEFQERMSNTQYQRGVEDMRKAGLNPALAYQQGGASSPTGASATMQNTLAGMKGFAQGAAQTYNDVKTNIVNREATQAQTAKTIAEAKQIDLESRARLMELYSRIRQNTSNASNVERMFPYLTRESQARSYRTEVEASFLDKTAAVREEAIKSGLRLTDAQARDTRARAQLHEYGAPAARNEARAEDMFYRRVLAPHVNDAAGVAGTLLNLRRAGMGRTDITTDMFYDYKGEYKGHRETHRRTK